MKLTNNHHTPEWEDFHAKLAAEQRAKYEYETARQDTNATIRRVRNTGAATVKELAEVLGVSQRTVINRTQERVK